MKLNNKGFTLIEVLAVIVILSILSGIAVIGVMSSVNSSKNASYKIMVSNIVTACNSLYLELSNSYVTGGNIFSYSVSENCDEDYGCKGEKLSLDENKMVTINLQTLVSNGFLAGVNNDCVTKCNGNLSEKGECLSGCANKNSKVLLNPKDSSDLGNCQITVSKGSVTSLGGDGCPTSADYIKELNGD